MLSYDDLPRLRELAGAACDVTDLTEVSWYDESQLEAMTVQQSDATFIAALNPATVIELLDMLLASKDALRNAGYYYNHDEREWWPL